MRGQQKGRDIMVAVRLVHTFHYTSIWLKTAIVKLSVLMSSIFRLENLIETVISLSDGLHVTLLTCFYLFPNRATYADLSLSFFDNFIN